MIDKIKAFFAKNVIEADDNSLSGDQLATAALLIEVMVIDGNLGEDELTSISLLAIKTTKNPSRMYLRWQYFIEQFRFDVDHTKGTDQPGDFLSRPAADSKDPSITITEDDSSDDVVPVIHSLLSSLAPDELCFPGSAFCHFG